MAERQGNEESLYQIQAKEVKVDKLSDLSRDENSFFSFHFSGENKSNLNGLGSDSTQNVYKVNGTVFKVFAEPTKRTFD
ncbi:hypothetical protein H5410_024103 [Solanum commersonii]|uniref:Uncharacterized protein n=1 Tax=Solanum commersonii TaxID=4109 RepID=A0A9J5ZL26_SOLCO|nr:hypothetical protein H5410_024103 [Solanum commersonii]